MVSDGVSLYVLIMMSHGVCHDVLYDVFCCLTLSYGQVSHGVSWCVS